MKNRTELSDTLSSLKDQSDSTLEAPLPRERALEFSALRRRVLMPTWAHAIMIVALLVIMCPVFYAAILSTQSAPQDYHYPRDLTPGYCLVQN